MTDERQGPIAGSLQHHLEELLDKAPAHGGDVELTATPDGASVQIDANVGKGWSVAAVGGWMRDKGVSVAAKARKTWGAKGA